MTNHIDHFTAEDIEGHRADFRTLAGQYGDDMKVADVEAEALAETLLRLMQQYDAPHIVILGSLIASLVDAHAASVVGDGNPRPEEDAADDARA